jgi:hypothetical protein
MFPELKAAIADIAVFMDDSVMTSISLSNRPWRISSPSPTDEAKRHGNATRLEMLQLYHITPWHAKSKDWHAKTRPGRRLMRLSSMACHESDVSPAKDSSFSSLKSP